MYIIYGDRTIIGFVGFVANLLNRKQRAPRSASQKVRPKKSYFSPACEFSLRALKKVLFFLVLILSFRCGTCYLKKMLK
jgi:hypothetical protein